MRFQQSRGLYCSLLLSLALLAIGPVGCSSDDTGGGPATPAVCAISNVNTDLIDSWDTEELLKIFWDKNGEPGTVLIELLKAEAVVDTIAQLSPNDGYHPWPVSIVGLENGSDYGVRVTGTGSSESACTSEINGLTITDTSNCLLTFTANVDSIAAGDTFMIRWYGFHTGGTVDIELWWDRVGMKDYVGDIVIQAPDTGSYTWTVDSFHNGNSEGYFYRIVSSRRDLGCEATSPVFEMTDESICTLGVYGISQGSTVQPGIPIRLELTSNSPDRLVDLRLYSGTAEFIDGGQIANGISVDEDFWWTVTNYGHTGTDSRYRIKATSVSDGYCTNFSDYFTIR